MEDPLPVLIAVRALIWSTAVLLLVLTLMSIAHAISKRSFNLGDLVGRVIGAALIFGVPLGIAAFAGIIPSALMLVVAAPPITYLFTALASLVTFRAAVRHPGGGMEGCTKLFGLIWSSYAFVWSAVSFEATGGFQSFEADALSLRWLQPPLAALPFALTILRLSGKNKRTLWLFVGTWVFVAACMAVMFFPVERGFASALLPDSDWLRFPQFALGVAAAIFLFRTLLIYRRKPELRRMRMRDLRRDSRLFASILLVMGLAWAGAKATLGALV